jgi:hypothetical protein
MTASRIWLLIRTASLCLVLCLAGSPSNGFAEGPAPAPGKAPSEPLVPLVAHRATYTLSLERSRGTKSPTAARGRLFYEFSGSAREGYSQVFRQVTEVQPAEGNTRLSDMRSATFEDGKNFSFYVKTTSDDNAPEIIGGQAVKKKNDVLDITLNKPTAETVDVDNAVLFPTEHLKRIIAAAKAGQHMLLVKVFDGSDDGKKVYDTTTIVGRPLVGATDDVPLDAMRKMRRWPVTISYFEDGKKDEDPIYTLGFELYENGVSRALHFDYGDFSLAGTLTSLELTPARAAP